MLAHDVQRSLSMGRSCLDGGGNAQRVRQVWGALVLLVFVDACATPRTPNPDQSPGLVAERLARTESERVAPPEPPGPSDARLVAELLGDAVAPACRLTQSNIQGELRLSGRLGDATFAPCACSSGPRQGFEGAELADGARRATVVIESSRRTSAARAQRRCRRRVSRARMQALRGRRFDAPSAPLLAPAAQSSARDRREHRHRVRG